MKAVRERGQVLVEFTLAIGFALTLLFGIIDFGRAMFAYNLVTSAAGIGSRYAVVRGSSCTSTGCPATSSDIQTYVQAKSPGLDTSLQTVTTTWGPDPGAGCPAGSNPTPPYNDPGCLVTVRVDYSFRFVLLPDVAIPMTSTSRVVISQ